MQHRANLGKTLADFVFIAAIVGMVVLGATQLFGHIFLWRHGTGPIVRILVALVVAHSFISLVGAFLKYSGTAPILPASTSASAWLMAL